MPRWPKGHVTTRTCPSCGGPKDYYAKACRGCSPKQRPLLGKKGAAHPTWKGGQAVDRDGYIRTYAPDHPWPRRGGYVLEHVRVMEIHLGRRMRRTEAVHHKDHDRQNNDLSNLEVLERGQHSSHHRKLDSHLRERDKSGRFK
jgi:hypothetical protein